MVRPSGKLDSSVHAVEMSGVMLTHDGEAAWLTRDDDALQSLMFCPPQKRIVAVYPFAGVSGSSTVPAEAGYVLTALLAECPKFMNKCVTKLAKKLVW